MPRLKRTRKPRQDGRARQGKNPTESEADALADPEVPNEVAAAEDHVQEQNNEVEDAADVAETAEGEGADVNETPRRRNRKKRSRFNRGKLSSTSDSSRKEERETRIAGMIFMCNTVTKKDCFKYGVFGFPEQKKDIVEQVKRGMKLFLYDIDKKHLHGIYEASSRGGMDLVPGAFEESDRKYPAQVRFRIHKDCMPLTEGDFKQAIKDNHNRSGRFRTELNSEQVGKLMRLFRPLDSEGLPQPRRGRDTQREPDLRDARRGPSRDRHASRDASRDRHARGSARRAPPVPAREPVYSRGFTSQPVPAREPVYSRGFTSPPVPAREPVYSREFTSLYARERPPIDLDYHRTQPSYLSASQIAVTEAEAARRRYLDNLYLEQTSLIAPRPLLLHDPAYRGTEYQREIAPRPLLHDPAYRGTEYQREMPYSSYGGSRNSGFPH